MSDVVVVTISESIREHIGSALLKNHSVRYIDISTDAKSLGDEKIKIILLHSDSFGTDKSALVEQVTAINPKAKIFVLSDIPNHQEAILLLTKGIRGYANSRMLAETIEHAVAAVEFGDIWIPPEFINELIKLVKPNSGSSEIKRKLSKKEYEVAKLVSQGLSNIEIADKLNITERTVKSHLTSVYERLRIKDRLALALLIKNV